jgi:hypothetical protein
LNEFQCRNGKIESFAVDSSATFIWQPTTLAGTNMEGSAAQRSLPAIDWKDPSKPFFESPTDENTLTSMPHLSSLMPSD